MQVTANHIKSQCSRVPFPNALLLSNSWQTSSRHPLTNGTSFWQIATAKGGALGTNVQELITSSLRRQEMVFSFHILRTKYVSGFGAWNWSDWIGYGVWDCLWSPSIWWLARSSAVLFDLGSLDGLNAPRWFSSMRFGPSATVTPTRNGPRRAPNGALQWEVHAPGICFYGINDTFLKA